MENARVLYDHLRSKKALATLVLERAKETVYLEFKTAHAPLSNSDKENLSVAVSGFANSDGGVILWGITNGTGKEKHNATGFDLIIDVGLFQDQINAILPNAVTPFISVEMTAITFEGNSGVVVMYVPSSERRPHRAELAQQRGYFKRVQDSFRQMEHFDLEDMFGRRQRPLIRPEFTVSLSQYNSTGEGSDPRKYWYPLNIDMTLLNDGSSVGQHVSIALTIPREAAIINSGSFPLGKVLRTRSKSSEPLLLLQEYQGVIYPEIENRVMHVVVALARSVHTDEQIIKWRILAENMRKQEGMFDLKPFLH